MRFFIACIILLISLLFVVTPNTSNADSTGTLEIALKYTNGDSVMSDSIEIKIFKSNTENSIKKITEKSLESTYITELETSERYRIDVFMDGIYSTSTFYELNKNYEFLTIQIPLSHGLSFQVLYDDKITPIPGIKVSVFTNDGIPVTHGVTNWEGNTQRFWIPPTKNNFYNAKFELNENLTYEFFNIALLPGEKSDLKIVAPWPVTSQLEVTVHPETTHESIPDNVEFMIKLIGNTDIIESKLNRGKAIFPKLPVGDYNILVVDSNTSNPDLKIWANQTITVSKNTMYENIVVKNPSSIENKTDNKIDSSSIDSYYFQQNHGWTRQSVKGDQVDDKEDYIIGNQSLSIRTDGNSSPVFTRSPKISSPISLEDKTLNLWLKIEDTSKIKELWFTITSDNFENGWLTYDYSPFVEKIKSDEWTYISLPIHNFKKTGEQTLSSINRIQIRISDTGITPINMKINELSFSKIDSTINYLEDVPTCNCVAFRLDDVQDFWLNEVQLQIMKTFEEENTPLTIGIIGKSFGNDDKILSQIKKQLKISKLEIANHGWEHESFIELDVQTQKQLMKKTNDRINQILNYKVKVFIPPFNDFNNETLEAMKENEILFFSSELDKSYPPYPLQGLDLYNFPETAFTGDLNNKKTQFVGLKSVVTLNQLKTSLEDYGFATITMHPQEFSVIKDGVHSNEINLNQLNELRELLQSITDSKIKIVLVSEINSKIIETPQIPVWIKNNAKWWSDGKIGDNSFVHGIQYMITEKIVKIAPTSKDSNMNSNLIPGWIKINAKWWSDNKIDDTTFVEGLQYLIKQGIIHV